MEIYLRPGKIFISKNTSYPKTKLQNLTQRQK